MTAKYRLNGGSRDAFSLQTSIIDLVHVKSSACVDCFQIFALSFIAFAVMTNATIHDSKCDFLFAVWNWRDARVAI